MTNIQELTDLAHKLTVLLQDPQPGLSSWRRQLNDVIKEIAEYSA